MPLREFSIFFYFLLGMTVYLMSLQEDRNTPNRAKHMTLW